MGAIITVRIRRMWKVLFSQVSVHTCGGGGGGEVLQSQVLSQVSGPGSFPGGGSSSGWGEYPSAGQGVIQSRPGGNPVPARGYPSPSWGVPQSWQGGVQQSWAGGCTPFPARGIPQDRVRPWPGQDWGTPHLGQDWDTPSPSQDRTGVLPPQAGLRCTP